MNLPTIEFYARQSRKTQNFCVRFSLKTLKELKSRELTVSRVLSRTIIHLRYMSPCIFSDLPESNCGPQRWIPIWSCSEWGLHCHEPLPVARCALTAPFHPYHWTGEPGLWRSILCCTFRRLTPPRRYLALCPMEPGLSSTAAAI